MNEAKFRTWLEKHMNYHTARTYTARCMRIEEKLFIDLDDEYRKDGGSGLLNRLKYSCDEQRQRKQPQCGLKFEENADIYIGMNSLRASVKKYFEFRCTED